jgi:hypothetical protein
MGKMRKSSSGRAIDHPSRMEQAASMPVMVPLNLSGAISMFTTSFKKISLMLLLAPRSNRNQ